MNPEALRGFAVIDFEASALPADGVRSYPIEVAVGLPETGQIRSWLIRPEPEWLTWDWYESAALIHRLSKHLLQREGRPRAEVASEVIDALLGRVPLSDAASVDQIWLETLCGAGYQGEDIRSIVPVLTQLAGDGGAALLEQARAYARLYAPRTHRAGDDVRHLILTIRELVRLKGQG